MRRSNAARSCPNRQETIAGSVYLAFQLIFLPGILQWMNRQLAQPLNSAELNFVYYFINFIAVILIFHNFLAGGLNQVTQHPAYFCQGVILGFVAYYACSWAVGWVIRLLVPTFSNYNDASIAAMSRGNGFLMLVSTVILVPPAEECFFRGLIFRNLYKTSHPAAYAVSMVLFCMIHILGYLGRYSPLEALMAVLQYLPAGLCLAWSYVKTDTIFAPILIHAAVNFITLQSLR